MPFTNIIPARTRSLVRTTRHYLLKWSVQRPFLSLSVIVTCCIALLPIVTAATLMPLAMLLNYTGILASQGFTYVIYNILIQGLLLATIIVALFFVGFAIATGLSVFHSYKVFRVPVALKKD